MEGFLFVGLGGALGAIGRYAVSLLPIRSIFPILTLLINLLGAVLLGFVDGLTARGGSFGRWGLFWKVGVCGGFTTFSTFSLEAWRLLETGRIGLGGLYVLLSVLLCLGGVALGQFAGRALGNL